MKFKGRLLFFLITSVSSRAHTVHEQRDIDFIPERTSHPQPIEQDAILPIRIALKQNPQALRKAEAWLMAASDPDSPKYGQYWTQEDVISAFQPSEKAVQAVSSWLRSHGVLDFSHSDNKQWLAFDIPTRKAEEMFQAKYFEREKRDEHGPGVTFEAYCDEYSIPADLRGHIDFVKPGVQASDVTGRTSRSRRYLERMLTSSPSLGPQFSRHAGYEKREESRMPLTDSFLGECRKLVTPECIRALYDISLADPSLEVSPNNTMGVFGATGQLYYQGSLDIFYGNYTPYIPLGTSPIFNPIDGPPYPPNRTHGPDWKYIGGEGNADLESALPIIYPQNISVFEMSLGYTNNFFNRFVDAIDGSYCTSSQRANSSEGGKPECGVFKPTNVITFSFASPERTFSSFWRERQCLEYLKLGLQGVSLFFCTQDYGVGWMGKDPYGQICLKNGTTGQFGPYFPPSCPWVTAVGATRIAKNNATAEHPEVAATLYSYSNNASIPEVVEFTNGGGFSLYYNRPAYQDAAVSYFFKTANPRWPYFRNGHFKNSTGKYNRDGRGFPDMSANGQNLALCGLAPGLAYTCDKDSGTSLATPITAAIFNRINEERIRAGKTPVGFVNPTLYKHPEAFHDITEGGNGFWGCKASDGFQSARGWDPVTGLGTPRYPKLLEVFMRLP